MPGSHQYFADPALTRLMGAFVALSGELFVAKATARRLQTVLEAAGLIDRGSIDAAAEDAQYREWLENEKRRFAESILQYLVEPDLSQRMHDEMFGRSTESAP
jgi:hypothetical protein